jgi:trigger factor
MSVKVENVEKNVVKLTIEVDAKKFEEGIHKSFIKNRKMFNIPGFRKGKAPRKIIETYYGEAVFYEDAINIVCPEEYDNAVKETKIEPVDHPEIDIDQIGNGENLIFTAKVTVKPDFELGEYKGIEVEKIEYNVTEEDIETKIGQMQLDNARLIAVEDRPVQKGDIVVIDYEGFVAGEAFEGGKGEKQELEIGSGQFIPGFEEQLIGKKSDEEVEVNVTFPEEYNSEELAGKDAMFKVKVHEIKFRELPKLDDEFAKDVSEFDTLEELRENTKKKLIEEAENKTKIAKENAVLGKIVEVTDIDIPEVMIKNQVKNMVKDYEMRMSMQGINMEQYFQITGMTRETFEKQFEEDAKKQIKTNLILEKINEIENIDITEEDIEKHLAKMAETYKMELEKVKDIFKGEEGKDKIKNDLSIEKVVDMLIENAKFIENKKESKDENEKV